MIVITGAAGFIGSNLAFELNRRGHTDLLLVDTLDSPLKHKNLNRLRFHDLIEPRFCLDHFNKLGDIELVLHQGACSDTTQSDGVFMMENNYRYSQRLFSLCQDSQIRFLYASSASVYGDGKDGFIESRQCEYPLNLYAFSKFAFDQWVRRHEKSFATQVAGLRYFNVYGPQENHKGRMASVVYQFHHQLVERGELRVFEGSEGFLRDFISVRDIVDINLFLIDRPEVSGIFNAGTGRARSFVDIAQLMLPRYPGASMTTTPFPDDLKGKYQTFTQADLSKLRVAGYTKPPVSLEDGVLDYVENLKQHDGYLV